MTRTDAQIAREWARANINANAFNATSMSFDQRNAIAAHILATTTPTTMGDLEWDASVHSGLCAEHPKHEVVRMMYETDEMIDCILPDMSLLMIRAEELTPIPGTKIDLTPRRESVPKFTPDHPTVLTTENDYASAPTGTVVASDFSDPWVKDDLGFWLVCGEGGSEISRLMTLDARRVLRWGETL